MDSVPNWLGGAGIKDISDFNPAAVDFQEDGRNLALPESARNRRCASREDLSSRFKRVPAGPWSDPPTSAVVMTLPSSRPHEPAGFLVAGISARLKLDQFYRDFFDLARTQIATAIAHARAFEEERKRAEALAEIDRAKTTFFSHVSHELRTPLTLCFRRSKNCRAMKPVCLRPQSSNSELVNRNGRRLLRLVNTLLDFSRIEAGRMKASYEPTDLGTFTAELASVFRAATERAGLTLLVDCPPLAQPVYIDPRCGKRLC